MSAVAGALAVGDAEGAAAEACRLAAMELTIEADPAVTATVVYRGLCAATAAWIGHGSGRIPGAVFQGDPLADPAWRDLAPRERWCCADWVEARWDEIHARASTIYEAEWVAIGAMEGEVQG